MITDAHSETLYNYAREFRQCHVVVDPLAGEEWQDHVRESPADQLQVASVRHEYFGKNLESAPRVLCVPIRHFDVLESLAGLARVEATDPARKTRSVCGFVAAGLSAEDVARQLAANLTIRVGTQKIYFRCFDPRVMHHLPALLPAGALALAGISSWAYFNWDGAWAVHAFASDPNPRFPGMPIRLTEDQWRPFESLAALSASVVAFKRAGVSCPCSESDSLRQAVANAMVVGLVEPEDIATYLVRSRQSAFPLAQHPRWSEALALVRSGASLAEALAGLDVQAAAA